MIVKATMQKSLLFDRHLNLLNPSSQLLVKVDIVQPRPNLSKFQNVITIR